MTTKFKHDHWTKGVTERVNHLRDTFWKFEPSVDIERSVIYTRTYKETEAEDTIIRRATSFKNYMNERTIDILPGELIVGTSGKAPKSFIFCPSVSVGSRQSWMRSTRGNRTHMPLRKRIENSSVMS